MSSRLAAESIRIDEGIGGMTGSERGSPIEEGFVPDQSTHGAILQAGWYRGRPQPSFIRVTKIRQEELLPITVHRCTKCGLLKLYAIETEGETA
jgi:hypothetical protein